jgi:SAM-dependent methyltransferase
MGLQHRSREVARDAYNIYKEGGVGKLLRETPFLTRKWISAFNPIISDDSLLFGINSVEDSYLQLNESNLRSANYHVSNQNSVFIASLIEDYKSQPSPSILEIGGNAGRHLSHLYTEGHERLNTIEMNPAAIDLYTDQHPQAAEATDVFVGRAQSEIRQFDDDEFDIVYTNAVIQHIPEPEVLLTEIARIASDTVIFVEIESVNDELESKPGLIFRNYDTLFSHDYQTPLASNGYEEVLTIPGRSEKAGELVNNFDGGRPDGRYTVRVFKPATQ